MNSVKTCFTGKKNNICFIIKLGTLDTSCCRIVCALCNINYYTVVPILRGRDLLTEFDEFNENKNEMKQTCSCNRVEYFIVHERSSKIISSSYFTTRIRFKLVITKEQIR